MSEHKPGTAEWQADPKRIATEWDFNRQQEDKKNLLQPLPTQPKTIVEPVKRTVEFNQAINYVNKIKVYFCYKGLIEESFHE